MRVGRERREEGRKEGGRGRNIIMQCKNALVPVVDLRILTAGCSSNLPAIDIT